LVAVLSDGSIYRFPRDATRFASPIPAPRGAAGPTPPAARRPASPVRSD
jgi:hypothetical protein